jgi:hypothetical protein
MQHFSRAGGAPRERAGQEREVTAARNPRGSSWQCRWRARVIDLSASPTDQLPLYLRSQPLHSLNQISLDSSLNYAVLIYKRCYVSLPFIFYNSAETSLLYSGGLLRRLQ